MKAEKPVPHQRIVCVGPDSIEKHAISELLGQTGSDREVESSPSLDCFSARAEAGETASLLLVIDSAAAEAAPGWVARLRKPLPNLRVAIYGTFDDHAVQSWLLPSIDALIDRAAPPREVLEAVAFVLAGNRYISPSLLSVAKGRGAACSLIATCGLRSVLLEELSVPLMIIQGERCIFINRATKDLFDLSDEEAGGFQFWDRVAVTKRHEARELYLAWQRGAPVMPRITIPIRLDDDAAVPVELFSNITQIAGMPAVVVICAATRDRREKPVIQKKPVTPRRPTLTRRQSDILSLLARGASNKEIARELALSEATVKLHVRGILRTFGCRNRTAAVYRARKLGLLAPR